MKSNRLVLISATLLILMGSFIVMVNLYDQQKREEILENKDTRLENYDNAKGLAREVINLIGVRDQESYNQAREYFKKNMTQSLFDEYFPSEEYMGGEKEVLFKTVSVKGDINGDNNFVFKLEVKIVSDNSETPLTLLAYIKDGLLYRIMSLG